MSTLQYLNPPGAPTPTAPYSQGVLAPGGGRWLHVAGQVGIAADGSVPADFEGQVAEAWRSLLAVLAGAGMDARDLVKVTTFVTDAALLPRLAPARAPFLGDARPASTLVVAAALARPEWLIEVEAVAWRA